jgi:sigma-E factor negative regulatory protein RseC
MEIHGNKIMHKGIVTRVDEKNLYVTILAESACSACRAKGMCNLSEMEEKVIEVDRHGQINRKPGDEVKVVMDRASGTRAVILGYILPFVLLVVTLFVVNGIAHNDAVSGLSALLILIPYYYILYLSRDRLKRTFRFRIE